MIYYILFTFLSVTSNVYLVSNEFRMENIIGGKLAKQTDFKYHVAILGKKNYSDINYVICGGGIISSTFVLSAALCFFTYFTRLRKITYSIAAGTNDLVKPRIIEYVDLIYTPNAPGEWLSNDIAVIKLNNSMNVISSPYLNKIPIPLSKVPFTGTRGKISGFGDIWSQTGIDYATGKEIRVFGGSDDLLYFAYVEIISSEICKAGYRNFSTNTQLCGSVISTYFGQNAGFCSGDAGGPLIIDNKLVGLASLNTAKCDDDTFGSVYTKVSHFSLYINRILGRVSDIQGIVYQNRPHIPQAVFM